jgi:hypothetical protein
VGAAGLRAGAGTGSRARGRSRGHGRDTAAFRPHDEALDLFDRVRQSGCGEDLELLLTMGRALYRNGSTCAAREVFEEATDLHPERGSGAACGYTLHRLEEETRPGACCGVRLHLDGEYHEARIYLGHLLYDRGDWVGAAREFERVPPAEHWDTLAIWRLIELKRALEGLEPGAAELALWERRLEEVEAENDAIDELLGEIEAGAELPESEGCGDGRGVTVTLAGRRRRPAPGAPAGRRRDRGHVDGHRGGDPAGACAGRIRRTVHASHGGRGAGAGGRAGARRKTRAASCWRERGRVSGRSSTDEPSEESSLDRMIDADRVLRPLQEASTAIEGWTRTPRPQRSGSVAGDVACGGPHTAAAAAQRPGSAGRGAAVGAVGELPWTTS